MLSERSRERRRLAAECFALAQEAPDSNLRAHLLEMAQKWLGLAELARPQDEKEAICLRAIQKKIGKQLRVHYGLPRELTHRILCLLMQLDAPEDGAHDAATRNGQDGESARRASRPPPPHGKDKHFTDLYLAFPVHSCPLRVRPLPHIGPTHLRSPTTSLGARASCFSPFFYNPLRIV
jgi:hypothetical protein